MLSGRFVDRMEKRDGRWGIVERTLVKDWAQLMPHVPAFEDPTVYPNGLPIEGQRGRTDFSYR
jgi:hypothetical protein